jgi:hypothetical protein
MKLAVFWTFSAAIFLTVFTPAIPAQAQKAEPLRLTSENSGETVTVDVGREIEVVLPGKTTDGDKEWRVKAIEYLQGPICTVSYGPPASSFIDPNDSSKGRRYTVRLQAGYPGAAVVSLAYCGQDVAEAETDFTLKVFVRGTVDDSALPAYAMRIDPMPLAAMLEKEVGGTWQVTRTMAWSSPERGGRFEVYYAPHQRDRSAILEGWESASRPMAIAWGGNDWTVVSDPYAWQRNRDLMEKLVGVLGRFRPNREEWKRVSDFPANAEIPNNLPEAREFLAGLYPGTWEIEKGNRLIGRARNSEGNWKWGCIIVPHPRTTEDGRRVAEEMGTAWSSLQMVAAQGRDFIVIGNPEIPEAKLVMNSLGLSPVDPPKDIRTFVVEDCGLVWDELNLVRPNRNSKDDEGSEPKRLTLPEGTP